MSSSGTRRIRSAPSLEKQERSIRTGAADLPVRAQRALKPATDQRFTKKQVDYILKGTNKADREARLQECVTGFRK